MTGRTLILLALATTTHAQDRIPVKPLSLSAYADRLSSVKQGAYESRAAFHSRQRSLETRDTLYQRIPLSGGCGRMRYMPDAGVLRFLPVPWHDEGLISPPIRVNGLVVGCSSSSDSWDGTNAFGATLPVTEVSVRELAISNPRIVLLDPIDVPMRADSAQRLVGALAWWVRVVPDSLPTGDRIGVRFRSSANNLATFRTLTRGRVVPVAFAELLLVHTPSRRILWRAPLVSLPSP